MMQLHSKANSRRRRLRHARHPGARIDLNPIRVDLSEEEILADLVYPAPVSSLERRPLA